jgi:hypothetical protein
LYACPPVVTRHVVSFVEIKPQAGSIKVYKLVDFGDVPHQLPVTLYHLLQLSTSTNMFFPLCLIFNFLLVVAHAKPLSSRQAHLAHKRDIQWSPCNLTGTTPILCGSLPVPLDYADPSSTATLDLELLKIPASKNSSRGSIFFNFGGPGDDGSLGFVIYGAQLLR